MIANKISGWYYDLQLENRLTCASLHPNRLLNADKTEWIGVKKKGAKFDEDFEEDINGNDVSYAKDPICRAILTEDFNVSVANSWSEFGGDMLGQMWESIKPLAPYVGSVKGMIHSAVADYGKEENKEMVARINESKLSKTLADVMIALDKSLNTEGSGINVEDYLNRALVVQGTRFSYYSGSGTSFGNLMMKFTIFPTFEGSTYKTTTSQVEEILPYCIGKFVSGTDGLTMDDEKSKKIIDNMIGWQKPPGGFRANVQNVDVIQEGTLLLRFGAYYAIPNLVIENATFNFSKQMTKNPTNASEKISPLYCDVTIQLRPATKYSDNTLRQYIFGARSNQVLTDLYEKMESNLKDLKEGDYVY
jgi:hypothetical protein